MVEAPASSSLPSSINPWSITARRRLRVPQVKAITTPKIETPPQRKRFIIDGPPSSIKQDPPPPPRKSLKSPRNRIRYVHGKRSMRKVALTADDLYQTDACPTRELPLAGHDCIMCQSVKSHPVMSKCGHSYCYICIRLRLEQEWTCPHLDCSQVMHDPPVVDTWEAESVAADYPRRVDESEVPYSWEGLGFPYH